MLLRHGRECYFHIARLDRQHTILPIAKSERSACVVAIPMSSSEPAAAPTSLPLQGISIVAIIVVVVIVVVVIVIG